MALSYLIYLVILVFVEAQRPINPSILQDSRNLPQVDGTFGFLYRTEDGIAHAAVGDSSGTIHGRFTYTDPSGSKINYNYNTGSRRPSGTQNTQENNVAQPAARRPIYQPQTQPRENVYQNQKQSSYNEREGEIGSYEAPQPQIRPRQQKKPKPAPQNIDYGSYSY